MKEKDWLEPPCDKEETGIFQVRLQKTIYYSMEVEASSAEEAEELAIDAVVNYHELSKKDELDHETEITQIDFIGPLEKPEPMQEQD